MPTKKSVFETLSKIDVSGHVETISMKKGPALKYVSWAWAWNMVKSIYPDATRTIEEYPEFQFDKETGKWYATGQKLDYRITPAGCEVKVTVEINGEKYSERLYVMDMRNQPVANPNIAQINKTQQRCLVKALAMAGLGLNLYAGEDLPMGDVNEADQSKRDQVAQMKQKKNHESLEKGLEMLASMTETSKDKIKAELIKEYHDTELYKADPTQALLNGTREMYRQLQEENQGVS